MNAEQRAELFAMRKALDGFINKIVDSPVEINANPAALRLWTPSAYDIGDVRMYKGNPYKCIQHHDSTNNAAWTPDITPSLWMQYHGTTVETARPWLAPTGVHDMYKVGEYMIWTDGSIYCCKQDTTYNPDEYSAAWGTPVVV